MMSTLKASREGKIILLHINNIVIKTIQEGAVVEEDEGMTASITTAGALLSLFHGSGELYMW